LPSWSVLAELDKIEGETVLLALPPAEYAASIRTGDQAVRCTLDVSEGVETVLDPLGCPAVPLADTESKGPPDGTKEGWLLELGVGGGWGAHRDAYVRRLEQFQLEEADNGWTRFTVSAGRRLLPHLVIGLEYFNLGSRDFKRDLEFQQDFSWNAHAFGPFAQADFGFGIRRAINLFVRGGAGISLTWSTFDAAEVADDFDSDDPSFENTTIKTHRVTQHFARPCAWLSGGLQLMPSRWIGFQFELRYAFAPGIDNEFGEVHDLGGTALTVGLRLRSWE
jgi:hypothetical protein